MKISRQKLSEVCRIFLEVLDKEGIANLEGLEALAGQATPIDGKPQDYLIVEWRPSNLGTRAIDASYVIQHERGKLGGGIPLSVKVNRELNYSQLIIKTPSELPGYAPFFQDQFGNLAQARVIRTTDLDKIRKEIKDLS